MRDRIGLLAILALLVAAPLHAQDFFDDWDARSLGPRSLSLAATGGMLFSSDWSDLVLLGAFLGDDGAPQQVLLRQVSLEPGPVVGGALTLRRGRGGARIEGAYSRSCLAVSSVCRAAGPDGVFLPQRQINVNTWMLDVDAEISLVNPDKVHWARPYVMVGLGGIVYDPDRNATQLLPTFVDGGGGHIETRGGNDVAVIFPSSTFLVTVDGVGTKTLLAGVLAAGTDLRIPVGGGGIGVRLQIADHIAQSPLEVKVVQLSRGGFGGSYAQPTEFDFGSIHNIRLTAGVTLDLGLGGATRLADRGPMH